MNRTSPLDKFAVALATLGPVGLLPKAPGTWGSLVAVIVSPWLFLTMPLWWRILALLAVLAVGTWACTRAEKFYGKKDPGCVVLDELFGQWLALLFCPGLPVGFLLLAFIFFRFFDILKPWPVRWAETAFPDGLGVMMDDGIAGLYALLCLHGIALIL
ncbi:phosphatidylglycerophosphatase A [Pseudodesulfovibrio sp.]|uniref:phosphatidylglycerophosphatase A family protein n=1 Tax=unclassified Pseudodesulfovibrio TaxID=2661612 RepID=UPI003AFFCC04